ncbi:MAG: Mur ligase family protein [Patescibacteria group bacterium]
MKNFLKIILKYYLKIFTKLTLMIHRPIIVAVSGSSNKNFVKMEIKRRLKSKGLSVRANPKNFNTEIGMPLAILNLPSGYNEYRKWIPAILSAPVKVLQKNFPDVLVLSLGSSDEGDMKYLLTVVRPHISVITDINQKYKEGFSNMNALVREYQTLTRKTRKDGSLILNSDNYRVKELGKKKDRVFYFGFSENADAQILKVQKNEKGQKVEIKSNGDLSSHQINRFGTHHAYAFAIGSVVEKEVLYRTSHSSK